MVLLDIGRLTTAQRSVWDTGACSATRWFPTGASMSLLQGEAERRTCATNPVGCALPYRGRGVGFFGQGVWCSLHAGERLLQSGTFAYGGWGPQLRNGRC